MSTAPTWSYCCDMWAFNSGQYHDTDCPEHSCNDEGCWDGAS